MVLWGRTRARKRGGGAHSGGARRPGERREQQRWPESEAELVGAEEEDEGDLALWGSRARFCGRGGGNERRGSCRTGRRGTREAVAAVVADDGEDGARDDGKRQCRAREKGEWIWGRRRGQESSSLSPRCCRGVGRRAGPTGTAGARMPSVGSSCSEVEADRVGGLGRLGPVPVD